MKNIIVFILIFSASCMDIFYEATVRNRTNKAIEITLFYNQKLLDSAYKNKTYKNSLMYVIGYDIKYLLQSDTALLIEKFLIPSGADWIIEHGSGVDMNLIYIKGASLKKGNDSIYLTRENLLSKFEQMGTGFHEWKIK